MKPGHLISIAVVSLVSSSAVVAENENYEELKAEAWRPLDEIHLESRTHPVTSYPEIVDLSLGADTLSLKRLLEEVQRRNPSLESALNAWRAALAHFPQVTALDDPVLSYALAPLSLDRPTAGTSQGRLDVAQRVELSQKFPWPGKRRLRGEMALQEARGARLDLETIREKILHEMKLAYFDYWYVLRALEINAINQELLQEFQNIAEAKYAAGIVSKQDALQAEVEREHLVHQGIVLDRIRGVTQARINALLNRQPETSLPPPPVSVAHPRPLPRVESLHDMAVRNRPELYALEARVKAKQTKVTLARKEYYPDFRVFGTYNSLWQVDELRPLIGASMNIPIRLGKRRGAVDEARAEAARLDAELAHKAAEVGFEVQKAYEVLVENWHVVELYEKRLIPAAEENLEAARSGYTSAEVDFLALITAQKLLMDTKLKRKEALASYHQSEADLEWAVAGPLDQLFLNSE